MFGECFLHLQPKIVCCSSKYFVRLIQKNQDLQQLLLKLILKTNMQVFGTYVGTTVSSPNIKVSNLLLCYKLFHYILSSIRACVLLQSQRRFSCLHFVGCSFGRWCIRDFGILFLHFSLHI